MVVPVILAGGVGSRLWPLSREHYPKQLLSLLGDKTLLQSTILRATSLPNVNHFTIVCNEEQRFLVKEQIEQLKLSQTYDVILEPFVKNTAPAIAICARYYENMGQDTELLILPADHFIFDLEKFAQRIQLTLAAVGQGKLITFGIAPTAPETGYGYIKQGAVFGEDSEVARIEAFIEKPSVDCAVEYLKMGGYFWNSGIFLFKASTYLQELQTHHRGIYDAVKLATREFYLDNGFIRVDPRLFQACPSESIDYAVMEKTQCAAVIALDTPWSDIGSWSALYALENKDTDGNVCLGDVFSIDNENCYVRSESRLIVAMGLKDQVVVETGDAILIVSKDKAQEVKNIVNNLKSKQREEISNHKRVFRPWGCYETINQGNGFKVKKISVKPRAKLSLQSHRHRAEHWIIVTGTARVTRGKDLLYLDSNQSIYISPGMIHCMENVSDKDWLEVIEVQTGSYLAEDDIVRHDDIYGRVSEHTATNEKFAQPVQTVLP